jgi:hypothetical protein
MAMDETTRRLRRKLEDSLVELPDGQIAALIEEARNEALAEAKAIIKGMMVQTILEHALSELESVSSSAMPAGEAEEQIRQEIEAIRKKIAENERLLTQVKASPIEAEEVQEPAAEEVGAPRKGEKGYGYYVYGIVGGDGSQPAEGLPEEGIDLAYPVYALPYQAIQAIVSKVSLQEFGQEELEANLNNMNWVEAKVLAHQGVLELVLASHALVPMRFCTIYQSEGRVQEMLAQHYDDFVEALAHLKGKQEWGVKVYCDAKTLAKRVGETSDRVKELERVRSVQSRSSVQPRRRGHYQPLAEQRAHGPERGNGPQRGLSRGRGATGDLSGRVGESVRGI